MAFIQVHRRSVHTVVKAIQNERSSGEGMIKAPGAGTAVGCGGRDSNKNKVAIAVGAASIATALLIGSVQF
jgi:hypothetical protein